jgi:hypothetical protein
MPDNREIRVIKGGPGVKVWARLAAPIRAVPGELVLIELPHNCFIDPEGAADADRYNPR